MANEPIVYLRRANLTADPSLGTTNSGRNYLRLRLASNTSHKDENGQWQNDQAFFWSATLWDEEQINLYRQLHKGDTVAVRGNYREEQGTNQNNEPVTYRNLDWAEVALLHAPKSRQGGGQPQAGSTAWQRGQAYAQNSPQNTQNGASHANWGNTGTSAGYDGFGGGEDAF